MTGDFNMTQPIPMSNEWVPLSKVDKYQDVLSVPATRWHRFKNTNGFNEKVCRKFGRKVLVHLPSFFAWLEEGNTSSQAFR
jgi:hypothetical protein